VQQVDCLWRCAWILQLQIHFLHKGH
jgi:hypothetical protein